MSVIEREVNTNSDIDCQYNDAIDLLYGWLVADATACISEQELQSTGEILNDQNCLGLSEDDVAQVASAAWLASSDAGTYQQPDALALGASDATEATANDSTAAVEADDALSLADDADNATDDASAADDDDIALGANDDASMLEVDTNNWDVIDEPDAATNDDVPAWERGSKTFVTYAEPWRVAGFCVIPVVNKRTTVGGINRWKHPPGSNLVAKWSAKFPDANVAIACGKSGVVVIDVDTKAEHVLQRVIALFGDTPLRTETRRGWHLWYGRTEDTPSCYLKCGKWGYGADFNVEIKGDSSYVLVAPSVFNGGSYKMTLSGVEYFPDRKTVASLPAFEPHHQQALAARKAKPKVGSNLSATGVAEGYKTNRTIPMNGYLISVINRCRIDFSDVEFVADQINSTYAEPLPDDEVAVIAKNAWEFVERNGGSSAAKKRRIDDMRNLGISSDAIVLLDELRYFHSARIADGDGFRFVIAQIMNKGTFGPWTDYQISNAFHELRKHRYVKQLSPASGMRGTPEYRAETFTFNDPNNDAPAVDFDRATTRINSKPFSLPAAHKPKRNSGGRFS
jgi:hypothetical protein